MSARRRGNKDNLNESDISGPKTLLKSFYTIYHISQLNEEHGKENASGATPQGNNPMIEKMMESSLVEDSINSPPIGGLREKSYNTSRGLNTKTIMALERWRHAQKPSLLPEPSGIDDLDSGAESETGLDLWNREVSKLHCLNVKK